MLATAGSALRAIRVLQVSNQLPLFDVSLPLILAAAQQVIKVS